MNIKDLLTQIYQEIDSQCISETDTVTMETIANVLVKYGADIEELV